MFIKLFFFRVQIYIRKYLCSCIFKASHKFNFLGRHFPFVNNFVFEIFVNIFLGTLRLLKCHSTLESKTPSSVAYRRKLFSVKIILKFPMPVKYFKKVITFL